MRIIAFTDQPDVIEKIVTHLGLWPQSVATPGSAPWCPRPHPMGPLAQPRLVDEHDRAAFGGGVFLTGATRPVSSAGSRPHPGPALPAGCLSLLPTSLPSG